MDNTKESLQRIINAAVNKLLSVLSENVRQMSFGKIVETTQSAINELGTQIIEQMISAVDDIYYAKRDKRKFILRNIKTRKMLSEMGEINLKRRLYYDKAAKKYFFAVDEMLDIEKRSRIEGRLKSKLIGDATLTSYGKASGFSGNAVSRQTVCNLCKSVNARDIAPTSNGYKKVDNLYIEADEDHIHLKGGKSAEVKLVYVHEGRVDIGGGRIELKNAKYFAALQGSEIWEEVANYVNMQYNVPNSSIKISGDGAAWIKNGLAEFPGASFMLDKFHVYKSITDISSGSYLFRRKVIDSINSGNRSGVLTYYASKIKNEKGATGRKRIADGLAYLDNNFDNIDLRADYGCSAEGHVSHVLSARMSARPMAWSEAGADKMAKLRAFYYNGGDFLTLGGRKVLAQKKVMKYNRFARARSPVSGSSIPCGKLVGVEMVYDEFEEVLKFILKKQ